LPARFDKSKIIRLNGRTIFAWRIIPLDVDFSLANIKSAKADLRWGYLVGGMYVRVCIAKKLTIRIFFNALKNLLVYRIYLSRTNGGINPIYRNWYPKIRRNLWILFLQRTALGEERAERNLAEGYSRFDSRRTWTPLAQKSSPQFRRQTRRWQKARAHARTGDSRGSRTLRASISLFPLGLFLRTQDVMP